MRSSKLLLSAVALSMLACASTTSYVETNATLGRVVVYRNGVAYFERTAEVPGEEFELAVPSDKVDDFLKSLTVLDAETKQPAPIAYPTRPPVSNTGLIMMKIQLKEPGTPDDPRKLLLSYVTEAPSWKPSYRIVIGKGKKVDLEAWAIVDNTSGEDWNDVRLGVGSSSALSFRFDLHSVRNVSRETLAATDLFAQAPPVGGSVYGNGQGVLDIVDDATLAEVPAFTNNLPGAVGGATADGFATESSGRAEVSKKPKPADPIKTVMTGGDFAGKPVTKKEDQKVSKGGKGNVPEAQISAGEYKIATLAARVKNDTANRYVVEGFASKDDTDKNSAALERANKLRNHLIESGVRPEQIDAIANTTIVSGAGGARIVKEIALKATGGGGDQRASANTDAEDSSDLEPIGTSHFESKSPMSVARGTSAMVSILHTETGGEVVYLYDPESARGSKTHAFKSVRIENPTESTLETGPVTVFSADGFVGEGMTEPIPGKSASFVPFALDRQIVVESKDEENEAIAKILTAQRGVLTTEMRRVRKQNLVVHNRLDEETTVYIRHTVPKGYELTKKPEAVERIGEAHLFKVTVPAKSKIDVAIEEATPVFKTVDIRSPGGMELVRAYVSSAALEGDAGKKLQTLVDLQKDLGNAEQKIETMREQMGEYKERMNELHAQIVTLKAVKTGGQLMKNLEKKLDEVSDKLSAATVELVAMEEQRMISRIKLQDGVAELSLDRQEKDAPAKMAEK